MRRRLGSAGCCGSAAARRCAARRAPRRPVRRTRRRACTAGNAFDVGIAAAVGARCGPVRSFTTQCSLHRGKEYPAQHVLGIAAVEVDACTEALALVQLHRRQAATAACGLLHRRPPRNASAVGTPPSAPRRRLLRRNSTSSDRHVGRGVHHHDPSPTRPRRPRCACCRGSTAA